MHRWSKEIKNSLGANGEQGTRIKYKGYSEPHSTQAETVTKATREHIISKLSKQSLKGNIADHIKQSR